MSIFQKERVSLCHFKFCKQAACCHNHIISQAWYSFASNGCQSPKPQEEAKLSNFFKKWENISFERATTSSYLCPFSRRRQGKSDRGSQETLCPLLHFSPFPIWCSSIHMPSHTLPEHVLVTVKKQMLYLLPRRQFLMISVGLLLLCCAKCSRSKRWESSMACTIKAHAPSHTTEKQNMKLLNAKLLILTPKIELPNPLSLASLSWR